MKQLLVFLAIAAIVLLVLGLAVQTVRLLVYLGTGVLIVAGILYFLRRDRD
ncbi:hypothetical protein [Arthrobacter mangrovi]|uniref:LPXTG cell wall anchor domain-containing protein n=1 Tax=Arthrobacter mangrovi TaxID=2966350 RepID=A0ABQ5MNP7_9MICC|nr:hypothetical protein [Arthrobacter mangrovi]GLB65566.1 hypothetical protein AHIS1636_00050 [Arthrobacter mangrovi]